MTESRDHRTGHRSLNFLLIGLYSPAIVGLIWQAVSQPVWSQKVLAIALLLLSFDLLKMAIFDLEQAELVSAQNADGDTSVVVTDSRLAEFRRVVIGTIILELAGLYGSWVALGWGAIVILLSQVGFNLLAQVKLAPGEPEMIQSFGVGDRALVLIADVVGIVLVAIGLAGWVEVESSIALLVMVVTYGLVKLIQR